MAHEVENMMFVGETPWHGLGIKLPENPTIEESIIAAGLNWNVKTEQLMIKADSREVQAFATVRETDNSILGVVGPNYKVLQNNEAFKFFQPFLDSSLATLETAGSLREGKRVFILAKVKGVQSDIVQNDKVESYILLSNSHDGLLSIRVGFTPVRVVCANTLALAHGDRASKLIRVRHSNNAKSNLEMIQKIMQVSTQEFHATVEQYRFLASRQVNLLDLKKYVKTVLAISEQDQKETNKGSRVVADIIPLFEKGRGNDLNGVKGTYWGAYNAFNEYLGYIKGHSQDNRLDSLWFGQSANLNAEALRVATEMAKAA